MPPAAQFRVCSVISQGAAASICVGSLLSVPQSVSSWCCYFSRTSRSRLVRAPGQQSPEAGLQRPRLERNGPGGLVFFPASGVLPVPSSADCALKTQSPWQGLPPSPGNQPLIPLVSPSRECADDSSSSFSRNFFLGEHLVCFPARPARCRLKLSSQRRGMTAK